MVEINGLDGTAGQVPTLLPSACCQLQSVRKYQAGREGSASHGCLEMIDIFMVKLGFLGSSIPPRGRFLGSGLHARVRRSAAHGRSVTCQGPGCTPTSRLCTHRRVQVPAEAMHSSVHGPTSPSPFPTQHQRPWLSPQAGYDGLSKLASLKGNQAECQKHKSPMGVHGQGPASRVQLGAGCLQGAAASLPMVQPALGTSHGEGSG